MKYRRDGDYPGLQHLGNRRRGDHCDSALCVGKLAAAIQIIPVPVMGGVSLLLYGVIGASGIPRTD